MTGRAMGKMTGREELAAFCFEGRETLLAVQFAEWVGASRRFWGFADEYRSKIRAKVRGVRDEEGMLDLWAELEAARVLLGEERFGVRYEALAAQGGRGPDFSVRYRERLEFHVEVRRVRGREVEGAEGVRSPKLVAVLCDKVGQMQAGAVNLLWLAADGEIADAAVVGAARVLRERAEAKDDAWFGARGFAGAGDFLKQYGRLSGIVVWQGGKAVVWRNGPARVKVAEEIVRAVEGLR